MENPSMDDDWGYPHDLGNIWKYTNMALDVSCAKHVLKNIHDTLW